MAVGGPVKVRSSVSGLSGPRRHPGPGGPVGTAGAAGAVGGRPGRAWAGRGATSRGDGTKARERSPGRLGRLAERLIGRSWRRVFTLALLLFAGGVAILVTAEGGAWVEVGAGFVGGSAVGLVFAIVQHTLDSLAAERQAEVSVRRTVTAARKLEGIDLAGADLASAYLWQKDLSHAHMDGVVLESANLRDSDLGWASLRGAALRGADLRRAGLSHARFDGADLTGARLEGASLTGAVLVRADLSGADLGGLAESPRADLSGAVASGARFAAARLPSAYASFLSAPAADAPGAVLAGSDLSCADLRGANLHGADLTGVDLSGADLGGALLVQARLDGACLAGARLERADLTGAVLDGSDLSCADLRGAYLTNVDLRQVTLTGAWARSADLGRAEPALDPERAGICLVDDAPAGGAAARLAPTPDTAAEAPASFTWPDRLVLVAGEEHLPLAEAVAERLVRRRRRLDGLNGDIDAVHLHDAPPTYGDPGEHGLPARVEARARPPRRQAWVELRPGDGVVEVVARLPGREPLVVPVPEPAGADPAGDRPDAASSDPARPDAAGPDVGGPGPGTGRDDVQAHAGWVASAVQMSVAAPAAFSSIGEMHRFGSWFEAPSAMPLVPMLDDVLAANPRNPVALVLRAWDRHSSDVNEMTAAVSDTRVAWSASGSAVGRAMAASKLAMAQGQIAHRATSGEMARARAAAAGTAAEDALACRARYLGPLGYDRPGTATRRSVSARLRARGLVTLAAGCRWAASYDAGGYLPRAASLAEAVWDRRSLERLLVLRFKVAFARAQSRLVSEEPDDLRFAIHLLREATPPLVRAGIPISPTTRNGLAYCLMAESGRFTRGAGAGYRDAMAELREVLDTFGVSEGPDAAPRAGEAATRPAPGDRSVRGGPIVQEGVVDGGGAAVTGEGPAEAAVPQRVPDMASAAARGEEAPAGSPLRRRVLRLALANLGNMYRLTKDFDRALGCYGAALYCDRNYLEAYGERAWLHLDRGTPEQAEEDMAEMLRRPVGSPQQKMRIVLRYIDALARVRREDEQGRWLQVAHDLDAGDDQVAERLRQWEERRVGA